MHIGTVIEIWRYPVKSMAGEQLQDCTVDSLGIPGDRGWALRDETNGEITNGKRMPLLMQCEARYLQKPTDGAIPNVEIHLPSGIQIGSEANDINNQLSALFGKPVSLWPLQPAENSEHYRRKTKAARVFGRLARYRAIRSVLPTLTSFGGANMQLREMFSREPNEPVPDISVLPPSVLEFTSPPGTYFDAFPIQLLTTASLDAMARLNPGAVWDVRRFRPNFLIQTDVSLRGLIESEWSGRTLRLGDVELKCEIPTARCGMTTHAQADLPKDSSILRSIVKDANQNLGSYATVARSGDVRLGSSVELI
jgi:uncharacterized protein YcbX